MTSSAAMEAELASVLADPTFVRSPVLTRLLAYLVMTTVSGDGSRLKSFSVAVDGLGRSPDLDPQVDTYARVQVARLRKALDSFYVTAGAGHEQRLTIDSGSYHVRLAPNGLAPLRGWRRRLAAVMTGPRRRLAGVVLAAGLVIALFATAAAVIQWRADSRASLERWRTSNFPSVIVSVEDHVEGDAGGRYADLIRQELLMRIGRYQGLRVQYDNSVAATYVINVNLYRSDAGLQANTFVVERKSNRLAWSSSDVIEIDPADRYFRDSRYISRTAFIIAHGAGIIHANERRRHHPIDTPYGCWLQFTAQMPNNRVIADPALADCARDWHDSVPDSRSGAGLYAWTLLDESALEITADGRREKIGEALRTLENARALDPSSGFVAAVNMRAYALAGEDAALRTAVEQALELNPGNLEIEGLAGTLLVFRNDPRGEAMIDDVIAQNPSPPPWYFIAKFTAAMMREDTAATGQALERLRQLNHTLPVLAIFSAAHEARTGQLQRAHASWDRAKNLQPILRLDPDIFFDRTPLGPAAKAKLKAWLGPVIDD